ncbi:Fasciclin-like arabinogalactan protein 3 [Linum grandiflorum]
MLLGIVCLLSTCFTTRVYAAYNITEVLSKYSDYSEFNRLLTSSGLAKQINSKDRTITLLVVNNGAVGSLSGKPEPTVRAVLSLHIVLDYLDKNKIQSLNKTTTLTTLYQETGNAKGDQGFLNATKTGSDNNNNQLMFGNGKEDAQLSVSYKKVVTTQSSHYSVIEVSSVIQAPWADNLHGSPHKAPSSSPDNAPAPSHSPPVPSDSANADDSSAPAPGTSSASLHAAAGGLAASFAVGLLASLFVMSF